MSLMEAIRIARLVLHGTTVDTFTRHMAYKTLAELHPIISKLQQLIRKG